jgi:uncharacterized membrane protein YeaQ/YmgE (transglycosylase-associated protein family)
MNLLIWLVIGFLSGIAANRLSRPRAQGCFIDIAVGIAGAVVLGACATLFSGGHSGGLDLPAMYAALIGALSLLFLQRVLPDRG